MILYNSSFIDHYLILIIIWPKGQLFWTISMLRKQIAIWYDLLHCLRRVLSEWGEWIGGYDAKINDSRLFEGEVEKRVQRPEKKASILVLYGCISPPVISADEVTNLNDKTGTKGDLGEVRWDLVEGGETSCFCTKNSGLLSRNISWRLCMIRYDSSRIS